jgi:site-specific recombinase XerD
MSDLIEQFAAEYHDYHGISAARRIDQVRTLRLLEAHVGGDLAAVTPQDLSRWYQALVAEGMAATTVRKYRGLVMPWLRWARDQRIIEVNAFRDMHEIRLPRGATGRSKPNPYSRDEIKLLWREIAQSYPWARNSKGIVPSTVARELELADKWLTRWRNGSSGFRRVRPYARRLQIEAIVSLMLCGALRRDECFNLTLDGLDPANAYVVAIGAAKNREAEPRPRAVPWTTPYMRTAVERWLTFREELAPAHDRPWLALYGRQAIEPMQHQMFEGLLGKVGRGWEMRRLRHTAATEMLRAGYPLHEVQRILGHASLQQTLEYAQLLPDDVVRTAARNEGPLSTALLPKTEPPTGVAA